MTKQRPICSEKVMLRLPVSLRAMLEQAAQEEGRSISSTARRVLEKWAAEREHSEAAAGMFAMSLKSRLQTFPVIEGGRRMLAPRSPGAATLVSIQGGRKN